MPKNPPEPMLRKGRPVDPQFDAEESLFRRIHPDNFLSYDKLKLRGIEFPRPKEPTEKPKSPEPPPSPKPAGISINRNKHDGLPEYVLWGKDTWGKVRLFRRWIVVVFRVKEVPPESKGTNEVYSFKIVHEPEEWNYFHSEIRCYSLRGEHVDPIVKLSREAQMLWRNNLRSKMVRIETQYSAKDKDSDTHQ